MIDRPGLSRERDQRRRRRRTPSGCSATSPGSGCSRECARVVARRTAVLDRRPRRAGRVVGAAAVLRRAERSRRSPSRATCRHGSPSTAARRASRSRPTTARRPLHLREPRAEARRRPSRLLAQLTGRELDEIHVVGGGARNALLCRWTADAAGRVVARRAGRGDASREPARAGDGAGRDLLARRGREIVRRSFAPRSTSHGRHRIGRRRGSGSRARRVESPTGGRRMSEIAQRRCAGSRRRRAGGTRPRRRASASSTGSSTARICSAPTARSPIRAAATPPPRR